MPAARVQAIIDEMDAAKPVLETLNAYSGRFAALDTGMRLLAVFFVLPLAVAAILMACCAAQPQQRRRGWITLTGALLAVGVAAGLQQVMARPRPFLAHPLRALVACPDAFSFPSFEMAAGAALAFGLFVYSGRFRWLPIIYIVLAGLARVFCAMEYPLDAACGGLAGGLAGLAAVVLFDWRYASSGEAGIRHVAAAVVLCTGAVFVFGATGTDATYGPNSGAHEAPAPANNSSSLIKGWSPETEQAIARALLKYPLPGRVMRVQVGTSAFARVAAVKFSGGTDTKPLPRPEVEKEALKIIITALQAAPNVQEVDVWAVIRETRMLDRPLQVVYSVCARRSDAAFLLGKWGPQVPPRQALARLGLSYSAPKWGKD